MKTYNEYRKYGELKLNKSLEMNSNEWWRMQDRNLLKSLFTIKGEYIEGTEFLPIYERNNTPVYENHTNVKNSEWNILFYMISKSVIDWLNENGHNNIFYYSVHISRNIDGLNNEYLISHMVKTEEYSDYTTIDELSECDGLVCDILDKFIDDHKKDIPIEWNEFSFGMSFVYSACEFGSLTPDSDPWMSLGNIGSDEIFDTFIFIE